MCYPVQSACVERGAGALCFIMKHIKTKKHNIFYLKTYYEKL